MKDQRSVFKSAFARLAQARKHADKVSRIAEHIERSDGVDGRLMMDLRIEAEEVVQCVHEFNAYWNVYSTD